MSRLAHHGTFYTEQASLCTGNCQNISSVAVYRYAHITGSNSVLYRGLRLDVSAIQMKKSITVQKVIANLVLFMLA